MINVGKYAKFIVAVLTAALTAASQVDLPVPPWVHSLITIVIAGLGAAAVLRVPNATGDPATDPAYDESALHPDNGQAVD